MRSIAAVKSSKVTFVPLRRVAMIAASFTRLARSAPVNPVVSGGDAHRDRCRARGSTFRTWTFENLDAALAVGPIDQDLAVEAAGPQQRRIEDFRPVGRGEQDDAGRAGRNRRARRAAG